MKKLYGLAILMAVVLLAIAGFQVYWVRDNYRREQKAVEVKARALFRETVREVQDSVLQTKLKLLLRDTSSVQFSKARKTKGRLRITEDAPKTARVLHMLGEQINFDTGKRKAGVFIRVKDDRSVANSNPVTTFDKVMLMPRERGNHTIPGDSVMTKVTEINTIYFNTTDGDNFKIQVDSLYSDTVPLHDLNLAYARNLKDEKIDIPFSINQVKPETGKKARMPFTPENFAGYQLELGNPFQFLIRKISMPILFSLLLVGLSVLAFILLYRGLLRQHRLAAIKNDLISNITHELKTPIATVSVAIEALKNFNAMQDPAKTREYLDISQNELQRLGLLVDKVLKLSMFEKNAIEIKHEALNIGEVVSEVVNSLRLQFEKQDAEIEVTTTGNLFVTGDRLHLLSVVFNLLDNALKYNTGKVRIQVNLAGEADRVMLSVIDNGTGIPRQYTSRIFEKFFRVPNGDTHNAKGHGLGLSYVSQVVQQHHGSIKVQSEEHQGSNFTIILPRSAAHQISEVNE